MTCYKYVIERRGTDMASGWTYCETYNEAYYDGEDACSCCGMPKNEDGECENETCEDAKYEARVKADAAEEAAFLAEEAAWELEQDNRRFLNELMNAA